MKLVIYNVMIDYKSLTHNLDVADPAKSPATRKKTRWEAATPWSLGSSTILGEDIMQMLQI